MMYLSSVMKIQILLPYLCKLKEQETPPLIMAS